MAKYAILCEKASAAKNFATALGGSKGKFEGESYLIVAGSGHMMTLKEPEEMVHESIAENYSSWAVNMMPWDSSKLNWQKRPIIYRDFNKKQRTRATDLAKMKKDVAGAEIMVIATDVDPSGEGELLAWEIIDAIGWKKPVYRMYFGDEAVPSIQKSFRDMKDISDKHKDGDYVKAEARNRFDFLSMQLTRLATSYARQNGYPIAVSRQGRLKSVIAYHIYEQLEAIKNYKRKPFYEVKFKDENGHTFARKLKADDDVEGIRFNDKAEGEKDKSKFGLSGITDIVKTRKKTAPGALLDLSGLASILATKGYPAKEVLATYQKMYEDQIVSYPRTEDKFISNEQFKEMVGKVDTIAKLVGVDTNLLTHRTARQTHVKDGGAHGANRPGSVIPKSLTELSKYGKSAEIIYTTLAKNFLAMYGEDYIFDSVTARLEKYPIFVTTFSTPIELNFKRIFDTSDETKVKDEDEEKDEGGKGLGKIANPFLYEGANKKPNRPSMKWIMSYLSKHNVGTGATRTSTLAEISSGKKAMLTEKRGVLNLTEDGTITAIMAEGTWISSVAITKQLFDAMDDVGRFKRDTAYILAIADKIIAHDKPIMEKNGAKLVRLLGIPKGKGKGAYVEKVKATGTVKGKAITFNEIWGGHTFTADEKKKLLAGEVIEIDFVTAKGKKSSCKGSLKKQSYKGKEFWGFKPDFAK